MNNNTEYVNTFHRPVRLISLLLILLLAAVSTAAERDSPGDPVSPISNPETSFAEKSHGKWQTSTFNAENLDFGGVGNRAAWCGETAAQEPGWAAAPGYGNNWNTWLVTRLPVSNPGASQVVTLDFFFNHDTEPAYDIFYVEYETPSGWQTIYQTDGTNHDVSGTFNAPGIHYPMDVSGGSIIYTPFDYAGPGNDEIAIRFRVTSDGAWSDEDGNYDTFGAIQIDNVSITYSDGVQFDDFETSTLDSTNWTAEEVPPPPALGCTPELPSHNRSVGFGTRGYWFESPATFDIATLRAPAELGSLPQSVEIVLIHAADADFQFPMSSSNFTSLEYFQQVTGGMDIVLSTPLRINQGDRIGILGGVTPNGTSTNSSYSVNLPGPYASSIAGVPVNFLRLGSDQSVSAGQVSSIFFSPYAELGRFEFVVLDCVTVSECDCTPLWALRNTLSPSPRAGAAMVYDSQRDLTVLFGGRDRDGVYLNDTWEFDGTTWTEIPTATQPSVRYLSGIAYDSSRGVTVIYGGHDSTILGDTWEWDGSTWTAISTTQGGAHNSMGMTYDPLRQLVVRYGGGTTSGRSRLTFEYDGNDWSIANSNSPPGYRSGNEMVFDPSLGKILLFGGQAPGGVYKGDTWTYDGTWTELAVSGPAPLQHHAMAADLSCGGVYMYGGIPNGTDVNDELWKFESGAWTQVPDVVPSVGFQPGDRWLHAMVYEPGSNGLLMVGGTAARSTSDRSFGGMFRYACGQDMSYLAWFDGYEQMLIGSGIGSIYPDSIGVDRLWISNIGSSGQDGVRVGYGEASIFNMEFDPVLPYSDSNTPTAAYDFDLFSNTSNDIEDEQFIAMRGDPAPGGTGIGADFSAIGASGYRAELWHANSLVASQGGFLNGESSILLATDIAGMNTSVDSTGAVSCGAVILDPSQTVPILLDGVSHNASSLRLVAESPTIPVTHFTNSMLTGSHYGTIGIAKESIGVLGAMEASGIGDLPSLRGESAGDVLRMTFGPSNGIADEGLYSSWRPEGGCDSAVSFEWTPLEGGNPPAIGSILRFEAEGDMGGPAPSSLGNLELTVTNPAAGAIEMDIAPDYSDVGSTSQRVWILNGGAVVAEISGNAGSLALLVAQMPTGCGKELLQLDGYGTACFRIKWSSPLQIDLTPSGPATPISAFGDAIAVLAESPSGTVSRLSSFSILADGLSEMELIASTGTTTGTGPVPDFGHLIVTKPYPNPFNPQVVIQFKTARRGPVDVNVYDLAGRKVRQLMSSDAAMAGDYKLTWDGTDTRGAGVASGIYLIRVTDHKDTKTMKATLVR